MSSKSSTNADRAVVIDTADWGGVGSHGALQLPDDGNLILTVHYYNPFPFTHHEADWVDGSMAWRGTRGEGTQLERAEVMRDMREVSGFAAKMNVPVFVGEFGAGFGVYDPVKKDWRPELLGALQGKKKNRVLR